MLPTWLRGAGAVLVVLGLYFVLPLHDHEVSGAGGALRIGLFVAGLAALTFLVVVQVRRALAGRSLADRISMLLTLVTVVVVVFAGVYYEMADQFSGLRTRLDGLYFSVATLCTVGYGDITAVSQQTRAIVTAQMLFDLIIVTSAISIIVSARREHPAAATHGQGTDRSGGTG